MGHSVVAEIWQARRLLPTKPFHGSFSIPMKFLVDRPLGGLTKWLRFCGFDAQSLRLAPDAPGTLPPPSADTFILTCQESLKRLHRADLLVLAAAAPQDLLTEVLRRLDISPRRLNPLNRCRHCNDRLIPLAREQARDRVPEHVFVHHDQFLECPRCHRVFWPGSHLTGIIASLEERLADLTEGN